MHEFNQRQRNGTISPFAGSNWLASVAMGGACAAMAGLAYSEGTTIVIVTSLVASIAPIGSRKTLAGAWSLLKQSVGVKAVHFKHC